MNLSGQAVGALARKFCDRCDELLVICDDLDLDLGTLRLRPSGGSGGHRGLASIISTLGDNQFPRLRLGVGRPPAGMEAAMYVLQPFGLEEREIVDNMLVRGQEAVQVMLQEGLANAMNRFNPSNAGVGLL